MRRDYKLIDQEPCMCVASVLQMILKRTKLYAYTQQYLSKLLDKKENFYVVTDLNEQVFKKIYAPLEERWVNSKYIKNYDPDLEEMVTRFQSSTDDFMIFANYFFLTHDREEVKIPENVTAITNSMHCMLISEIVDDQVVLVCPETVGNGGTHLFKVPLRQLASSFDTGIPAIDEHCGSMGYSIIHKKGV